MSRSSQSPFSKLIAALSKIEPNEWRSTSFSFLLALTIMTAYYTLRPVRDAMSSDWTDVELTMLWTANFVFSFAIVATYGYFASRLTLKRLVPSVYVFFAMTFVVFYGAAQFIENTKLLDKAFYVWVSAFALFPVSIFWSFIADQFTQAQSKRLFGVIATGLSVGAILGPFVPLIFAAIGTYNLMLVAAIILLLTYPLILAVRATTGMTEQTLAPSKIEHPQTQQSALQLKIGGSWWSGFRLFLKSPFLLGIGLFLFLYTGIGSFVYFELKNLMTDFSREQRTEVWALIDIATNFLTILGGLFITSRLATKLGLGVTLAIVPIVVFAGMISIAVAPILMVVVILQIVRRGGNYAITRPAKEMLFTYVDRETRFKAKQVIDVIVYRGADVFWASAFTFLTTFVGLGVSGVAVIGALIALLWALLGLKLGKYTSSAEEALINQPNEHKPNAINDPPTQTIKE